MAKRNDVEAVTVYNANFGDWVRVRKAKRAILVECHNDVGVGNIMEACLTLKGAKLLRDALTELIGDNKG